MYDLLGVPPTAEPAELKKAYHQQCLRWHPDKHQGSAESQRRANNIFQRVANAYGVLGGEVRRADYDLQRHRGAYDGASPGAYDPGEHDQGAYAPYAKENVPAGGAGFGRAPFSKPASSEGPGRRHAAAAAAAAAHDAYDAPDIYDAPAERASGAAARAFYEAFAAAEDAHRPTYHHRWSAYATNLFDGSDIEH